MCSYSATETFHGYLSQKFPEVGSVQKHPPNLHTRQNCFQDNGKSFANMLILWVNSQICDNVKKILENVAGLSFQLSLPLTGQKMSEFFFVKQTETPRQRPWHLMIRLIIYCSWKDLELKFLKKWIKIFC